MVAITLATPKAQISFAFTETGKIFILKRKSAQLALFFCRLASE